jgi:hypothetical protein
MSVELIRELDSTLEEIERARLMMRKPPRTRNKNMPEILAILERSLVAVKVLKRMTESAKLKFGHEASVELISDINKVLGR